MTADFKHLKLELMWSKYFILGIKVQLIKGVFHYPVDGDLEGQGQKLNLHPNKLNDGQYLGCYISNRPRTDFPKKW